MSNPTTEESTTPRLCAVAACSTYHPPTSRTELHHPGILAKRYIGLGHDHPQEKPPNLSLRPDDKTYNTTVNQIRYKIERVITNIKTWIILHTNYRRPLQTFPETITAILGLIFTYTHE